MLYPDMIELILSKSSGRIDMLSEIKMQNRIFEALKRTAYDTIPLTLLTKTKGMRSIHRRIDSETFILIPHKPKGLIDEEIDIDESLTDAVAYYTLAGLEVHMAKRYMGLYHTQIELSNARLVETYLATASDDSIKFHVFP